jgi:orotidine-5'-phosphate decarboxylase
LKLNLVERKMNFFEKLTNAIRQNNSLLCVGLDPDPSIVPEHVILLNHLIIKATANVACAYKPNLAIYESMGTDGMSALRKTLDFIREVNPDIPIIGDGKRGDIGPCSFAYTRMLFEKYEFDAVTVNPYMGSDSIKPFLNHKDKGILILCRTSNEGGKDIQELMVMQEGDSVTRPLYEIVAELSLKWNEENNNVGLVVGATYPEQIARIRQICPNMLFLIPGVGAQGGSIEKAVRSAADTEGKGFIINVSRQIMRAAKKSGDRRRTPREAVREMRRVAHQIRDEINSYLPTPLKETQKKVHNGNGDKAGRGDSRQEESTPTAAISGV